MCRLIIIITIVFLQLGTVNSQCCPYLGDISIIPENPSTLDSIYLVTNVTTPNVGLYLGYEIENGSNNEITVRACYWDGKATALTDFTDTINLGLKAMGSYSVHFIAVSSSDDMECVAQDSNAVEVTFDVAFINATKNLNSNEVKCFPNPFINQEIGISSIKPIKEIQIINVEGKVVIRIDELDTYFYKIDTQELAIGSYYIKLIDKNNKSIIKKIVKLE